MYPFVRNNGSQKYVFVHSPAADLTFTFRTTFHKNVILLLGLGWFTAWHVSQPCATTDNPYVSLGIECWCYTSGTLCIMFCFCAADSFLNLRIHLSIFSYHASKVLIVKIFVCPYYKSLLLMHMVLALLISSIPYSLHFWAKYIKHSLQRLNITFQYSTGLSA